MAGLSAARRITLFLPVGTPEERLAAAEVASFVHDITGGYTHTSFQPPVLRGNWSDGGQLYIDEIALLFFDLSVAEYPPEILEKTLESLRAQGLEAYRQHNAEQIDLSITVESIEIYQGL